MLSNVNVQGKSILHKDRNPHHFRPDFSFHLSNENGKPACHVLINNILLVDPLKSVTGTVVWRRDIQDMSPNREMVSPPSQRILDQYASGANLLKPAICIEVETVAKFFSKKLFNISHHYLKKESMIPFLVIAYQIVTFALCNKYFVMHFSWILESSAKKVLLIDLTPGWKWNGEATVVKKYFLVVFRWKKSLSFNFKFIFLFYENSIFFHNFMQFRRCNFYNL